MTKELETAFLKWVEEKRKERYLWVSQEMELEELTGDLEMAFEAGVKEGGVKWHDLRKNPDDLPTDKHFKITSDGDIALYDCFWGKWYDLRSDELTYQPAAWCEIPRLVEA